MLRRVGLLALVVAAIALCRPARAADNPKLYWKTIETTHFRVNYYSTEDEVAARVATLAEDIYKRLVPVVGWAPTTDAQTEIVLNDQTDSANGSASGLPYDVISLNVTAPDDMSPLADVDDWYLELVTHEYTHILHVDHIQGLPKLINKILGKTVAPNQNQPHWILEGLAVLEESRETSGGRLRSTMWNMWMCADALEDNLATIDVFSNIPRRWPQGNIWYVYGSFFLKWLIDHYGEAALRGLIDDYAYQLIPYGFNRSIRRVTGHTFEELYDAWVADLKRDCSAAAAEIRARGVREGVRLTHTGNTYEHPRWIPPSAWPDHANDLLFFVDDGHTTAGLWGLPLVRDADGRVVRSREDQRELLIRINGITGASFFPDGGAVFSSSDIHDNLYFFDDLFELPPHVKSPSGLEGTRTRWSDGWRALDPSVSPDGRRVVFTTNHRGTSPLVIADVVPSKTTPGAHELTHVRKLVEERRFDQAYTPRWSPDGRHVAFARWRKGGYRDIVVVDTLDGSIIEVTHDRAQDGDPVYSPDGKRLFFHSDRSGVSNVYAYDLDTGRLRQVTNSINGAYQPEPSPDGKTLAYVGYTHEGYDIFAIPLDEDRWVEAPAYRDTRPPPPDEPARLDLRPRKYSPWATLAPRKYSISTSPGNFGQALTINVGASDIAGQHSFALSETTEWGHPEVEGSLSYTYTRLPFDFGVSLFRQINPASNYSVGGNNQEWVQQTAGVTTSVGYSMPRAFDGQSINISHSLASVSGELPLPSPNPYDIPSPPGEGTLSSLHLGWSYSNAQGYLWSVGNERGFGVSASFDVADPVIGSEQSGYAAQANANTYFPLPWARHHVLALHGGGGLGADNRAGKGPYYVGGFVDLPLIQVVQNDLIQGGIQLRGYPPVVEAGNFFALFNAEYRFPIINVDRGPSTVPIFVNRVSGVGFVDEGSAFSDPLHPLFLTGVGGELWFDAMMGYVLSFTFRMGYARGVSTGGIDKTYFIAAVPF